MTMRTAALPQTEHYSTGETCAVHASCSGEEQDCRTEMGERPRIRPLSLVVAADPPTSLEALRALLSEEAYEASDGSYAGLPTWGPETAEVRSRIWASCPEGDLVSWDTQETPHRYLVRRWAPAAPAGERQQFVIEAAEEVLS